MFPYPIAEVILGLFLLLAALMLFGKISLWLLNFLHSH